jgi:hypothetical protein
VNVVSTVVLKPTIASGQAIELTFRVRAEPPRPNEAAIPLTETTVKGNANKLKRQMTPTLFPLNIPVSLFSERRY